MASRYWLPETLALFDGSTTVVEGGGLDTVTVIGALVVLKPSVSVATLWRV